MKKTASHRDNAIGIALCGDKWRPIISMRKIKRGANKGKYEVGVSRNFIERYNLRRKSKFIVDLNSIKLFG